MSRASQQVLKQVLFIAAEEVGYSETPPNTNRSKYGKWAGIDGLPWCGAFVSWVYSKAGMPLGNIGVPNGFVGCQYAVTYFKKKGKVVSKPQSGDIVFFDWNGDGRYDHTGIFVSTLTPKTFRTIEGNTAVGNDSNGGQVMARERKYANAIFVRP